MNDDPAILLTPQGQELLCLLADAADEGGGRGGASLALAERLRRAYPAALVAAAMTQQDLRRAAAAKFSRAGGMLFTRAGYEQSSSEAVARYRAARLAGASRVADLCCGIGGDLIALAGVAGDVLAVDRDEVHARLAVHNANVYGADVPGASARGTGEREAAGSVRAVACDVRDVRLGGFDAAFIDPARRSGPGSASAPDARRFRAGTSEPPLGWCTALADRIGAVCVKAAPGLPGELVPEGWEAEFIAEGRELKEAVLWSPALATAPRAGDRGPRRATVLPAGAPGALPAGATAGPAPETAPGAGEILAAGRGIGSAAGQGAARGGGFPDPAVLVAREGGPVPLREPGEYLLDPNPAVTRAGLVEDLARELGGDVAKIDPRIAFLTLDRGVRTPFARTLRVAYSAPWHEKDFARRLRELDIGAADIRRRGLAGDVEAIRRRLKLSGAGRATVVITRVNDKPWGLVCTSG